MTEIEKIRALEARVQHLEGLVKIQSALHIKARETAQLQQATIQQIARAIGIEIQTALPKVAGAN